jgi:hypothetical protein
MNRSLILSEEVSVSEGGRAKSCSLFRLSFSCSASEVSTPLKKCQGNVSACRRWGEALSPADLPDTDTGSDTSSEGLRPIDTPVLLDVNADTFSPERLPSGAGRFSAVVFGGDEAAWGS